jgi:hypothetical protein
MGAVTSVTSARFTDATGMARAAAGSSIAPRTPMAALGHRSSNCRLWEKGRASVWPWVSFTLPRLTR